ncbi:MAG TPA: FAD binding domain-containing protein, partial [Anaerovoracaceae bacterium]|nr:FAD binding domain-containing protein [Anaerovoracaceae bacterium]
MKNFNYESAESFEQASELLKKEGKNVLIAGGTDLIGVLKEEILPEYPAKVVDVKRIPNSNRIEKEDGVLKIGALTKLKDIVESADVNTYAPMLAEAAKSVATPLLRNTATIGGNICQDVRCWYYRYPHEVGGRLVCSRKGGETCYALQGDNRYHSIFGGMKAHTTPCASNCPAGTDIPAYMAELRKGNIDGAAKIIMGVNPMPMLTSRVCAHTCQDGCNRGCNDESVS